MTYPVSRPGIALLLASLITLLSSAVFAQVGTGGSGADGTPTAALLASSDFTFHLEFFDPGQKTWIEMSSTDQSYFFNRARCECDGDVAHFTGYFRVAVELGAATSNKIRALLNQNLLSNGTARLYAGSGVVNCLEPSAVLSGTALSSYCLNLIDPNDPAASIEGGMAAIATTRVWHSNAIPAAWLFNAVSMPACGGSGLSCDSTASCGTTAASANIYFWAQTSGSPSPDMQDSYLPVYLVGQNPFEPDLVTAQGGNEAVSASWSWPGGLNSAGNAAFLGVQIFCTRGQDNQVFTTGTFAPAFQTSARTCPGVGPAPSTPGPFSNFDPAYLCSDLIPASATTHRITGLQNGIAYGVAVAAVDRYGNLGPLGASGVVYATAGSPDGGAEQGGPAGQGGGCALAGRPSGPRGLLGLLALGGLLITCTRRSRPGARRSY